MQKIPSFDPLAELDTIMGDVEQAVLRVVRSGHYILGPEVQAFEKEMASYLGVAHGIGVNSGTDALVIALRACGVGPGDEVVTTPFSFFATTEAIEAVGARCVFVDIDPRTYNLDVTRVEEAITPRTKALLPVHLYGNPCEMGPLVRLARERDLRIVEDVAQATGARIDGRIVGTFGDAGAFSFFPTKNLGALGDGGLIASADAEVARLSRMLRAHGSAKKYYNELVGYNSRLDEMQAAVLRVKLPGLEGRNAARRAAAARYTRLLRDVEGVVPPVETQGGTHVYHQYTVRIEGDRRDAVRARLEAQGVSTMVYYPHALPDLPVHRGAPACPEATRAAAEVLSLPIWPGIEADAQQRVVDLLAKAIGESGNR